MPQRKADAKRFVCNNALTGAFFRVHQVANNMAELPVKDMIANAQVTIQIASMVNVTENEIKIYEYTDHIGVRLISSLNSWLL